MVSEIISAIRQNKVIAIFRGVDVQSCTRVAQALYDGGIRLMELPYDQCAPETWVQTAQTIGALAAEFAGKMYIGAGTVITEEQAELTCHYGGHFVVSPDVNEAVIAKSCALGLVSIPGALTPTEILTAHRAGAHFVKVFPAGNMGSGYLKAVKAPASHVELLAFGGIDESNIGAFLSAGAAGAGVGVALIRPEWVKNGEFDKIADAARKLTAAVK